MPSFAWGNEVIDVTQMEVPSQYNGRIWTVTALPNGQYSLRSPDDEPVVDHCDVARVCRATVPGGVVTV
ncbi:hypothetical protein ACFT6Y_33285, partial [[Kitasatospora] papulosa]